MGLCFSYNEIAILLKFIIQKSVVKVTRTASFLWDVLLKNLDIQVFTN